MQPFSRSFQLPVTHQIFGHSFKQDESMYFLHNVRHGLHMSKVTRQPTFLSFSTSHSNPSQIAYGNYDTYE